MFTIDHHSVPFSIHVTARLGAQTRALTRDLLYLIIQVQQRHFLALANITPHLNLKDSNY